MTDLRRDDILEESDTLTLDTSDTVLIEFFDRKIKLSEAWYEKEKDLSKRQKMNEEFLFGKYKKKMKNKSDSGYRDNVLYEAESTIKPIALSRMPDLLVTPGNDTEQSKKSAEKLTDIVNSDIKKRDNRRVLNIAFKHVPIYFFGVIKARWNPKLGKYGDYEFYNVHPSKIIIDHNCRTNNLVDAEFIAEKVSMTVKEATMRFPKTKDELLALMNINPDDTQKEKKMSTKIQVYEVHFVWYEETDGGYTPIHGVAWKYKTMILHKMKDPNWDWEGDKIVFQYDDTGKKKPLTGELATDMFQTNVQTIQETTYRNYFDKPEFPYYIMGYDQYGSMPIDETSRIEQSIPLQKNIDDRGDQIKRLADTSLGRHVWSTGSGMKKEDLEELDMDDTSKYALVNGSLSESHKFIPGEQPSPALFNDLNMSRDRLFGKMGTNATTRGIKESDTATTSQILREADFGRIDDIVEDTINPAAEWMARCALQFIKLRYTKDHMRKILGKDGETIFQSLANDEIENGMEVIVHASGVDKIQRKREAYERAKMQLTDPLTFFEDAEVSNPKERTERLLLFMKSPDLYLTKYVQGLETTEQQVSALGGLSNSSPQGSQQLTTDLALLSQGQTPPIPQPLDPAYVAGIDQFLQSPDFQALPPEIQQVIATYAQSLVQASQQPPQQPQPSANPLPVQPQV